MSVVFGDPDLWPKWIEVYDGGRPDWDVLFKDFRSTVDVPANQFYRQLADHFPAAKVILTHRDSRSWYRSMQETLLSAAVRRHVGDGPISALIKDMGLHTSDPRTLDPGHMIDWYERHNEEVTRTIPADRLLVYKISEGWEPLCRFLDVPVPAEAFPHVNSTEAFKKEFLEDFQVPEPVPEPVPV